ncbi:MAG: YqgE/AlgH family protein [Bacteroidales bacterium]|nr:YqgE/AlgH family protein [Bacteroidales bacterium]MCF8391336.1 YqgE/AlgH family protein [Bacteroidales bacterium]
MDLNIDFFEIKNDKKAEKGRILISEPFLSDSYFKRSVVYLTEHTNEGSVGFVLNKPIELDIKDVLQDFPDIGAGFSLGGPVNTNTIHYIHTLGDKIPESILVKGNIFWGGDFEVLKDLLQKQEIKPEEIRFFLGYSGWTENQLDRELEENAWLVAEIDNDSIMNGIHPDFWKEVLKKMDSKYQVWVNFPENPGMN